MKIGEKLLKLRKDKNMSQEDVAFKLNVTRQTISKWETNQSTPDLDKIVPICKLFNVSTEEIFNDTKKEVINENSNYRKATIISISVFLYFLSLIWIIISNTTFNMDEGISVSIFFLICSIATIILVFHFNITEKKEEVVINENDSTLNMIISIISTIFVIFYLLISMFTGKWHITWIIWLIYALLIQIIKLIHNLKSDNNE